MVTSPETFDDLVLCCPADEAKKMLDRYATWPEKYVLGGVKFFNITIIHSDTDYFQSIFEAQYDPALGARGPKIERNKSSLLNSSHDVKGRLPGHPANVLHPLVRV